ncbi:hypothetical protein SASPL_154457 [Salvia splendens]|uniref:t-SNARE coiled-coil homology domain-containing protein n=1 Tax=Salvia splendens TaxID=180675 RepID=A0A8X8W0N0_SALSN|nr:hypothetical protein SASPL_154457 [Salvia splendens]
MISEQRSLLPASGREAQRYVSDTRRKISILRTRLDTLHSLLPGLPSLTKNEMDHRVDMVSKLRSKVNDMASTLNMSRFELPALTIKGLSAFKDKSLKASFSSDAVLQLHWFFPSNLDSYWLPPAEQDEDLEQLEVTIVSTKHIALAVNEERDLQKGLIEKIGEDVDVSNSKLQKPCPQGGNEGIDPAYPPHPPKWRCKPPDRATESRPDHVTPHPVSQNAYPTPALEAQGDPVARAPPNLSLV